MLKRFKHLYFLFFLFLATTSIAQPNGQMLYQQNCAACHQFGRRLVGPDLIGVNERRSEDWLIRFIRNSQELIQAGDPEAVAIYNEFNQVLMPPQNLNEEEILAVLNYIHEEGVRRDIIPPPPPPEPKEVGEVAIGILAAIFLALLIIAFVLYKIRNQLSKLVWEKFNPGVPMPEPKSEKYKREAKYFWNYRVNHTIMVLTIILVFVLIGSVVGYQQIYWVGNQQGYAPDQPIQFSHALHSGSLEIDCQYCHTGVEKGKHANIPAVNICMNCHSAAATDRDEVQKIIDAYENQNPIEWIRIHNIPDFAYFNHAAHVKVAGIDCETCHGDVRSMDKVSQVHTLQMGWCINCHRESEINMENEYYKATFRFMEQHQNLTIAQVGGQDCARCHY